ncbi:hypothetical protein [Bacillus cereus]|uniref:hypothetical protein n=1 Tax=Bacillus cereus TaxID=1396 RepID=UPI0018F2DDFC|nr:hypothetical protein [Bacillus cereus]MBJ7966976.1 hypothetical protein [Bacillus cereus]MBJ8003373.1 hypothetical protein [Bacillus cereus]
MSNNKVTNMSKGKKRGPKEKISDVQMKELALQVKNKIKQQQLTYSMLEKETGIGRQTWKRRLDNFIQELNKPILRRFCYTDSDEVYFPNIESIFDAHGNNKQRIINELHHFELLFQELYKENSTLKERINRLENFKEKIDEYIETIANLQQEVNHYKTLYEQIIVSSIEPHIRDELGLTNNLLDFSRNIKGNTLLMDFQQHYPKVLDNVEDNEEIIKYKNIEELKNQFKNLF